MQSGFFKSKIFLEADAITDSFGFRKVEDEFSRITKSSHNVYLRQHINALTSTYTDYTVNPIEAVKIVLSIESSFLKTVVARYCATIATELVTSRQNAKLKSKFVADSGKIPQLSLSTTVSAINQGEKQQAEQPEQENEGGYFVYTQNCINAITLSTKKESTYHKARKLLTNWINN